MKNVHKSEEDFTAEAQSSRRDKRRDFLDSSRRILCASAVKFLNCPQTICFNLHTLQINKIIKQNL